MSDFFLDIERVRSEAYGDLKRSIEGAIFKHHFRSGTSLSLLTAVACEVVASVYAEQRDSDPTAVASMLRWIADDIEASFDVQTGEDAYDR